MLHNDPGAGLLLLWNLNLWTTVPFNAAFYLAWTSSLFRVIGGANIKPSFTRTFLKVAGSFESCEERERERAKLITQTHLIKITFETTHCFIQAHFHTGNSNK